MKNFSRLLCILFFILNVNALGHTTSTQADRAFGNFVFVFRDYQQKTGGDYPVSWENFGVQMQSLYPEIMSNARKYLDIENRYIFLTPPPEFIISGKKEKFVMMTTDAELEGRKHSDHRKPTRRLVVEQEDGQLRQRLYTEIMLGRIFAEKNLDLSDYTKKKTFKSPRSHKPLFRNPFKSGRDVMPAGSVQSSNDVSSGGVPSDKQSLEGSPVLNRKWLIIGLIILALSGLIIGIIVRIKKS